MSYKSLKKYVKYADGTPPGGASQEDLDKLTDFADSQNQKAYDSSHSPDMYHIPESDVDSNMIYTHPPDPSQLHDQTYPSVGPEDLLGAGLAGAAERGVASLGKEAATEASSDLVNPIIKAYQEGKVSSTDVMRELLGPRIKNESNIRTLSNEPAVVDDPTQIIDPKDDQAWFNHLASQKKASGYAFGGPVKGNQEQIYNTFGCSDGGKIPDQDELSGNRRKLKDLIRKRRG